MGERGRDSFFERSREASNMPAWTRREFTSWVVRNGADRGRESGGRRGWGRDRREEGRVEEGIGRRRGRAGREEREGGRGRKRENGEIDSAYRPIATHWRAV